MTEILSEQTIDTRSDAAAVAAQDDTQAQQATDAAAAQYYYPPGGMNMAMTAAAAASVAGGQTAANGTPAAGANGATPAYPYYYPTGDASALSDPAAAAAAATAAAAAMAASAAAYGIPNMAGNRRTRHAIDVGPYFKPTKQICSIYSMDRTRNYNVRLLPRVDKGFFLAENDWTCYRRNYFQLTTSFTCTDSTGMKVELPCLVDVEGRGLRTVTEFQVLLTSRTANGTREVDLVQHTAKRDKGPQATPLPKKCDAQDLTPAYGMRADNEAYHSVTFERIQFKSATANNGKRRAAQQYHTLMVELLAKCDDGYLARVASSESAPLVVRGRAPGHYHAMATKEAQENADAMGSHFPYYPPHGGDGAASHYYPMMQSGYYYHPYYWAANMAAGASAAAAAAASAEQLAALGQVEGAPGSEEMVEEGEEELLDQGESANMTEATATGTPENEMADHFDDKKRALEDEESAPSKRRGRPKKQTGVAA